jgi:hypothetical protein
MPALMSIESAAAAVAARAVGYPGLADIVIEQQTVT